MLVKDERARLLSLLLQMASLEDGDSLGTLVDVFLERQADKHSSIYTRLHVGYYMM